MFQDGTLYWITGLAGSGKTTIGKSLYIEIKKEVYKDEEKKKQIENFRQKQMEVQSLSMEGKLEESEKKYAILQQMYQILMQDENIKKMFDAEVKFDILVGDMYKILGEAIKGAIED